MVSIDGDNFSGRLGVRGGGVRKESFADDSAPAVTPTPTGQPTRFDGSIRTVAGAGGPSTAIANDATPAATGASSNGGVGPMRPTVNPVFPDELGLRAVDAVGSDGGQFAPPADINIALSPTATAGAVTTIDCRQAAATLATQGYQMIDPKVLQAAIVAATKARRA